MSTRNDPRVAVVGHGNTSNVVTATNTLLAVNRPFVAIDDTGHDITIRKSAWIV